MEIRSFLGIRNTSPIRSIPNNALSDAINIDIDDAGVLSQRNGYALAKSLSNVTSAYTTQDKVTYVVAAGTLHRILPDLSAVPLSPTTASAFTDQGKVLFTNDGLKVQDDAVTDLKVPVPNTPLSFVVGSGNWVAGQYSFTYCYKNASGLEGATAPAATITIPENSAIQLTPPLAIAGYTVVYYMTEAGGTVYYDQNGVRLQDVQILANPFIIGCAAIAYHESSLWLAQAMANGSTVIFYSNAFFPHLYDVVTNYIIVPGEVRAMMSLDDGLLIGTDAAIYLYTEKLNLLANYGVPSGRAFVKTPDGKVRIFSNRGVCEAMPFENQTEKKALFAPGVQCSTALVDQNGIQKFVALSDGSGVPYNTKF